MAIKHFQSAPDYRWAAQKIEKANPTLKGVLLTAVQQHLARQIAEGQVRDHRAPDGEVRPSLGQHCSESNPTPIEGFILNPQLLIARLRQPAQLPTTAPHVRRCLL